MSLAKKNAANKLKAQLHVQRKEREANKNSGMIIQKYPDYVEETVEEAAVEEVWLWGGRQLVVITQRGRTLRS